MSVFQLSAQHGPGQCKKTYGYILQSSKILCNPRLMQSSHSGTRVLNQSTLALRRLRVAKGLSKVKLAELTGISTTHMTQIELGQRSASPEALARLALALGCEPEDLMSEELIGQ